MKFFRGKRLHRFLSAALAGFALLLAGCQSLQSMFQPAPAPFPKAVALEPTIRPGISLQLIIMTAGKNDEHRVTVSQGGEITLPLINAVKCEGLTLQELRERVQKACEQYYQNPQVSVQFLLGEGMLSPWGTVLVQGEGPTVGRAGPVNIPSTCDLTVTRALQLAGGVTPLGNQNKVRLTRKLLDGKICSVEIDVQAIGKYGKREHDYVLQAEDVIWVPQIIW
jgi:protein involved in polysaccharide export with SLBB domain